MDQNAMQSQGNLRFEMWSRTRVVLWANYFGAHAAICSTYTNNPQLVQSVCTCSLRIINRYSGNCRKHEQARHDTTRVVFTQKVALLN